MKCCRKLRDLCRPAPARTRIEWAGGVIETSQPLTAEQVADFVALFDLLAYGEDDRAC